MSSKKHADSAVDLNIPYEQNEIQLKGILGFAIGLFLLIVVTFGLMWALLNVMKDYSRETAGPANPMAQTDRERLPPEPRIQAAPGFGVQSDKGWVNMELSAPQSEYWELSRQWKELWEKGHKDAKTGVVTAMPIDEAKAKLLSQNVKAKSGADAEAMYSKSSMAISESSGGRMASVTRR
ncbi:MAG: hypothetical protein KBF83_01265 [Pyrinomonadaceae bacterium]|jgi:hypothetical protein|nr:hypothetical protein [Acidobacteriota bacterium]MBP7473638.1 hypothetical protein [Pyrinomonadaceae bacterium]MBP9108162.1 hypothetical protein [Pyrinomonadaceae bacterium]